MAQMLERQQTSVEPENPQPPTEERSPQFTMTRREYLAWLASGVIGTAVSTYVLFKILPEITKKDETFKLSEIYEGMLLLSSSTKFHSVPSENKATIIEPHAIRLNDTPLLELDEFLLINPGVISASGTAQEESKWFQIPAHVGEKETKIYCNVGEQNTNEVYQEDFIKIQKIQENNIVLSNGTNLSSHDIEKVITDPDTLRFFRGQQKQSGE